MAVSHLGAVSVCTSYNLLDVLILAPLALVLFVLLFLLTTMSASALPGQATFMKGGAVSCPDVMELKMARIFLKEASWMDSTWSWWKVDTLPEAPLAMVGTVRT